MRVEVGAGDHPKPGYIHTDIRPLSDIEHVCNAWQLPFSDGSVDEIYTYHCLEHLTEHQGQLAVAEWFRVLRHDGKVEIHVPDIAAHVEQFNTPGQSPAHHNFTNRYHALLGFHGWQRFPEDVHQWSYTFESLAELLKSVGFGEARRIPELYDPKHPERGYNPLLLWVEAVKP